jgi:hypothetical protein
MDAFRVSICFIALLLVDRASGMISLSSMFASGPSSIMLTQSFGLAQGGVMNVAVQVTPTANPSFTGSKPPTLSNTKYSQKSMGGYFLMLVLNDNQMGSWFPDIGTKDPSSVSRLCTQPAAVRHHLILDANGQGNFTYTVPASNQMGASTDAQYSVALLQCYNLKLAAVALQVTAKTEMYNIQPTGAGKSYLSIDNVPKVRILQGELIVYVLFVIVVIGQILLSMKPWYVLKLHVLFAVTILFGLALTAATYGQQANLNNTGIDSPSVNTAVSVIDHFNTTTDLVCFLLLSMGWCTTRIALSSREIKVISGVIALYFIIGMALAVCSDPVSQTCQSLNLVTYILRNLILLGIIIAMNFTVTQLRAGLIHSPWIPSTPVQYARVKQFQVFRIVFILYLLLPTAFLLVQSSFFSWKEAWIIFLLNDVLTLYMYFHIGATFAPLQEPFLIRGFDNTFTQQVRG